MFFYLASPYSHPDERVRQERYEKAMMVTAKLMTEKTHYTIFSPIVHCHEMALRCSMPTDHVFWKKHNVAMLKRAKGLIVLTIDGWKESIGVTAEIELAQSAGKTVRFIAYEGRLPTLDAVE